ncbi:alpha/beta hydrolase [Thalassomonas actiniarum]|uniref:Alpha/beta hydrolase n=1 Tax=Thalassomonas actiniarum TaxID=485447 RepID=A0AAE9YZ99_9GAMM|nr:alpha/beta hydrolase [Thalassomonas actiniarum]WDE02273.1 alpha/beta hydrolase [Thalassomonas actiniarum]
MASISPQNSPELPFYLALSSSPCGQAWAEIVVGWSPQGKMESQCFLNTKTTRSNLWRSPKLIPTADGTLTAWHQDGTRLAVSQFLNVHESDLQGGLKTHSFSKPVSQLVYDDSGALLVLAGESLYQCPSLDSPGEEQPQLVGRDILALAAIGGAVYLAKQAMDNLLVVTPDGEEIYRYALEGRDIDKVSLKGAKQTGLFLALGDRPIKGKCRFTLLRLKDNKTFFDNLAGVGIAELQINCRVLDSQNIALLGELDTVSGLYLIDENGQRQRLNAASLEADLMSWSPNGQTVIVSGKDARTAGARRSQCLGRDGYLYRDQALATCEAIWLNDLDYIRVVETLESAPRWTLSQESLPQRLQVPQTPNNKQHQQQTQKNPAGALVFSGNEKTPDFAILYVMGPHRFFANGPERLFYHYSIRSELQALTGEHGLLLGLNGSGALGSGSDKRVRQGIYARAAQTDIDAAIKQLRKRCSGPVFLVAASLGCLPALAYLADNDIDGAAFINPVYSADIPPLQPWRHLYSEDNSLTAALDSYAPKINTPLLLVHGQRDPISPSQHSSDFMMSLPEDLDCHYVTVQNEGHIFQSHEGWQTLLTSLHSFIRDLSGQIQATTQEELVNAS